MLHDLPSQTTYGALFGPGFDAALGCTTPMSELTCLQDASVNDILAAQVKAFGAFGISPDFGTKVLPNSLETAFTTGDFIHVPVLQGTNANEGRLFEPGDIPFDPSVSPETIIAAEGPANFDLANANAFCAVRTAPTCRGSAFSSPSRASRPTINTPPSTSARRRNTRPPISRIRSPGDAPSADEGAGADLHRPGLCLQRLRFQYRPLPVRAGLRLRVQRSQCAAGREQLGQNRPTTCSVSRLLRSMPRSCSSSSTSARRSAPTSSSSPAR